jgi:hypothetical protein
LEDFPFWMGLAPAMGFLLDGLLGGLRRDSWLAERMRDAVPRMEFVLRTGLPDRATVGIGIAVWAAAMAGVPAYCAEFLAYSLLGPEGVFAARAALFLLAFSARRMLMHGIAVEASLHDPNPDGAESWLAVLGVQSDGSPEGRCGAAFRGLVVASVGATLVPLVWGGLLGGAGAVGAVAAWEALRASRTLDLPSPARVAITRIGDGLALPASLLSALTMPPIAAWFGGRRTSALAGFVTHADKAPEERLAASLAAAFDLGAQAGGMADRRAPEPRDVQHAVQVLFVSGAFSLLAVTTVLVAAYALL